MNKVTIIESRRLLKDIFGYSAFRPLQEEIIENILQKNDTLVIMPTGGGKSLCYQIPALQFPGLTIVISPLISLMKDQVEQLQEVGVNAIYLNSSLNRQEYSQAVNHLKTGRVDLLYVAPETLLLPFMIELLEQLKVDSLTIDEAHCISEWGHDFRPEYRNIAEVRKRLPEAVCVALTATATPKVRKDIAHSLGMTEKQTWIAGFDRKNLFIEIKDKVNPTQQVVSFIKNHKDQPGIIYCHSRNQVEILSNDLKFEGYAALPYHAGLSENERTANQDAFIKDDIQIIVATIAFGMGINKPNVRFVIHYDIPKNIESYYQQIGRAGRDGLKADCLMLFSYGDIFKIRYFIDKKEGQEKITAGKQLNQLIRFVESPECRRIALLDYFGDAIDSDNCGMCDNCTDENQELIDITKEAQMFLSCMVRTGNRFGMNHIIKVLRGSKSKNVLKWRHDKLSTFGIGHDHSEMEWRTVVNSLIHKQIIAKDDEYGVLVPLEKSKQVLKGKLRVFGKKPDEFKKSKEKMRSGVYIQSDLQYDSPLFIELKRLRKEISNRKNIPPYIVFSDKSLIEMATNYPLNETDFMKINGVGNKKMEQYGDEFLDIIREYYQRNKIAQDKNHSRNRIFSLKRTNPKNNSRRIDQIRKSIHQGNTVTSILDEFAIKEITLVKYLDSIVRDGIVLPDHLLTELLANMDSELVQPALTTLKQIGYERLKPVYEYFEERISYDQLRILRIYLMNKEN